MHTATATTDLVFDLAWVDPDTQTSWLYNRGVCYTYDDYRKYPQVVTRLGVQYVKAGWNSDTGSISYRQAKGTDVVARRF